MLLPLQRILLGFIVCLFPLLIYCLLLIGLNGRRRASMIPGTWDFAGVLLATSGFLLGGGPLILAGLNAGWRRAVLTGTATDWRTLSGEGDLNALAIWVGYFVALVVGAAILIARRRNITVLYNTDTDHIRSALEWVFGRLAIVWSKSGNGYQLQKVREIVRLPWSMPMQTQPPEPSSAPPSAALATARLDVRVLPTNRNVTMVWHTDDSLIREQVESELRQLMVNIRAADNPVFSWLASTAVAIFGLMICALVFIVLIMIRTRGGA